MEFIPFASNEIKIIEKTLPVNKNKDAFIYKYRLTKLKTEDDTNSVLEYYYDHKSEAVFEYNNTGPTVFMKCERNLAKKLLERLRY